MEDPVNIPGHNLYEESEQFGPVSQNQKPAIRGILEKVSENVTKPIAESLALLLKRRKSGASIAYFTFCSMMLP